MYYEQSDIAEWEACTARVPPEALKINLSEVGPSEALSPSAPSSCMEGTVSAPKSVLFARIFWVWRVPLLGM